MHLMPLLKSGLFAAFGIAFLLSRLWAAGESREEVKGRGTVAAIDPLARELKIKPETTNAVLTFHWDEATRFCNIDGPIAPEALRVGLRVSVCQPKKSPTVARVEVEPVYGEEIPVTPPTVSEA